MDWGTENELNNVHKQLAPITDPETFKPLRVNCVAWNQKGTVLAIGYAQDTHFGWWGV